MPRSTTLLPTLLRKTGFAGHCARVIEQEPSSGEAVRLLRRDCQQHNHSNGAVFREQRVCGVDQHVLA